MARKRKKRTSEGSQQCKGGKVFKMKTKRGTRCACAKTKNGRFTARFIKSGACPVGGKAITYWQAERKFAKFG